MAESYFHINAYERSTLTTKDENTLPRDGFLSRLPASLFDTSFSLAYGRSLFAFQAQKGAIPL
ncbi:MAG: hypothetical protein J7L53_07450 [Deltaproteobacteria bacterium]|nr:hypothetical protein [Deltaproteobacteria bacterium]